jgi:hypothetical protein
LIWNADTGEPLTSNLEHREKVAYAHFAHAQPWLVTASRDATAVIWDIKTGEPVTPPFQHSKPLLKAEFTNGDSVLLATDESGDQWRWVLPQASSPVSDLVALADGLSGSRKIAPR